MVLRKQQKGNQKPWKLDELKAGLLHFYKENGHYPTATEVDRYPYLPAARSIERSHGGLVKVRKELGLGGQDDYRCGEHSTKRAEKINRRAHKTEAAVYEFLCGIFRREFVHREYFFTDDRRTRADFFVYDKDGGFCVDVFYPEDRHNLTGCLNSKLSKFTNEYMRQYPAVFLQMNDNITEEELKDIIKNKKKPLLKRQHLMGWQQFKAFCQNRRPLRVA